MHGRSEEGRAIQRGLVSQEIGRVSPLTGGRDDEPGQGIQSRALAGLMSEGNLSVSKQSDRNLLAFDARPAQGLNDLPSRFFLHIHQRKSLFNFNRADHAGRYTGFIGNGSDQIAWPDACRPPCPDIHTHGSGCSTTATRTAPRRSRTIPLRSRTIRWT